MAQSCESFGARQPTPKRWGILYLGTKPERRCRCQSRPSPCFSQKGNVLPDQEELLSVLEGIIILDGNWQQAKNLWWRNAWMLKCRRLVLQPPRSSLYAAAYRKEPRKESVSTIEAAAYAVAKARMMRRWPIKFWHRLNLLLEKAKAAKPVKPARDGLNFFPNPQCRRA